jgi:hypothetical protein
MADLATLGIKVVKNRCRFGYYCQALSPSKKLQVLQSQSLRSRFAAESRFFVGRNVSHVVQNLRDDFGLFIKHPIPLSSLIFY